LRVLDIYRETKRKEWSKRLKDWPSKRKGRKKPSNRKIMITTMTRMVQGLNPLSSIRKSLALRSLN
jgi:hypothetical protein